jgi:Ser/Thr protein kinase RdoA (MazF antagonist)
MNDAGHDMAQVALRAWGGAAGTPRLVAWRENIVYDVALRDGRRAALRLHRPGYQTRAGIEAELGWMAALGRAGVAVPAVIATDAGEVVATAGDRLATMVGWIEGVPIGSAATRLAGSPGDQRRLMAAVGRLIAGIHNATDAGAAVDMGPRHRWDADGLIGSAPNWGPFWANPAFDDADRRAVTAARGHARGVLAEVGAALDMGPIHADCLRENILRTPAGLAVIDFDDCGAGFRLYDLATALVHSLEEPALPEIVDGLIEGYRDLRSLPDAMAARLPLFVMFRTFASAGWIMTRAAPDDPRQRFYAARAARLARRVLAADSRQGGDAVAIAQTICGDAAL